MCIRIREKRDIDFFMNSHMLSLRIIVNSEFGVNVEKFFFVFKAHLNFKLGETHFSSIMSISVDLILGNFLCHDISLRLSCYRNKHLFSESRRQNYFPHSKYP